MSRLLINQYYTNLDRVLQFGKSRNEQSIRTPFFNLLNEYARKQNFEVIAEITCMGTKGKAVRPDGIVKNLFGLDIGLWESKDEKTSLDEEIDSKIRKGYPLTNILFEDSNTAVLYQRGTEVDRVPMRDPDKLHRLLGIFFNFKSETVYRFEDAMEKFKADIPTIVETLRSLMEEAGKKNDLFISGSATFLELCKAEINPLITEADIREMMIQHILTSDIFNKIFDDPEFHRHNNIARELEKLLETLFTYGERKNLLGQIEHYYDAINSAAAGITDHHEKQKFLKVLYENFYKVYNPKAADRLGVVYTPNEIVKFMIESTDYLLHKHFNKTLADPDVEILDPTTGTGTFITSLIDYIPKQYLAHKYLHEIHANEVAILPYYVANLNVEFTFKQKMGYYEEFKNLCFVDTLDNTDALAYSGKQQDMFGLTSENTDRIKRQNSKKISVIIGNPPYNANQQNWNEFNKNREYPSIDKRIKDSYIKFSNAQKTKVYDMFARFFRWASDRIDENGIICFITNNAYINKKTYDGFRKSILEEFHHAFIIDLGGDIRELSGKDGIYLNEAHTIFGQSAAVGIAIAFLIKNKTATGEKCKIEYIQPCDIRATRVEKIDFLKINKIQEFPFQNILPDKNNNWINIAHNDFLTLLPIKTDQHNSDQLFKITFLGVSTNRDEWVYDFEILNLEKKMYYFAINYNLMIENQLIEQTKIKWSRDLRKKISQKKQIIYNKDNICRSTYRPFLNLFQYADKITNDFLTQKHYNCFGNHLNLENKIICFASYERRPFALLAFNNLPNLNYFGDPGNCLPLYSYNSAGTRHDNITDWGLSQFTDHYKDATITKEEIFHYTYAVLHNPEYRKKYELNLKREFPRLPFYEDFRKWAGWGKQLMELHINYEAVDPYDLKENSYTVKAEARRQVEIFRESREPDELYTRTPKVKPKLKADKAAGIIEIDELTFLSGIPEKAWEYKLGNRSALEWVLDQYKEKKPSDPTIAEKFNTYRFADYKTKVIDLLKRVCTVSVETVKIVEEMK